MVRLPRANHPNHLHHVPGLERALPDLHGAQHLDQLDRHGAREKGKGGCVLRCAPRSRWVNRCCASPDQHTH